MNKTQELVKIAEIHASNVNYAIELLKPLFPISVSKLESISRQDFLVLELLCSRFAKLQDFIGAKLVDVLLEAKGDIILNMTMIDKINMLEKLGCISNANLWFEMRAVRKLLAHEYPDDQEMVAENLNKLFVLAEKLLEFWGNIKRALV